MMFRKALKVSNQLNRYSPLSQTGLVLAFLCLSFLLSCSESERQESNRELAQELWSTFDTHYAFFELRGVDWKNVKETMLSEAEAAQDDAALFDVFCNYLQKFNDSHVNLVSDSLQIQCNGGAEPPFYQQFPTDSSYRALLAIRDSTLAEIGIAKIHPTPSDNFQWGASPDRKWGYLRIKRFYGISPPDLEVELDRMMDTLVDVQALILDVRTNPGGNDLTAIRIAEHFYQERTLGYFKQERNGPGYEDFTDLEPYWLEPRPEDRPYLGKVYLVTNSATGSAADVFAMMIYQRANVTRVGTDTEGIFSDMYRDTLSNGWTFTLSHQRYYAATMELFEKMGVPVEYQIANTMEDLERGFDPVIKTVAEIEAGNIK